MLLSTLQNPNLVIAVKKGDEPTTVVPLDEVVRGRPLRNSTVEYALKGLVPSPTTWHRTFWGEMAPDGVTCRPTLEFPYHQWMQTTLGELPVPANASCLLIQQLPRFKAGRDPSVSPTILLSRPPEVIGFMLGSRHPRDRAVPGPDPINVRNGCGDVLRSFSRWSTFTTTPYLSSRHRTSRRDSYSRKKSTPPQWISP